MSILVAVADSHEGAASLRAGVAEAQKLGESLVVVNLGLRALNALDIPQGLEYRVVDRQGRGDRDPVDAVLDEIADDPSIGRVVIGLRKRSRVGKALLGSISQRILLDSPVPVLAVKTG